MVRNEHALVAAVADVLAEGRLGRALRNHGAIAVVFLLGWLVWSVPAVEPMNQRGMHFLATMIVAVSFWILEVVDEYVVGLLLLLSWVVLDIVPSQIALAGFATNSWFFTIGALGIAAAVSNTSLLRRFALSLVSHIPLRHQQAYVLFLLSAGVLSGTLLPTGKARAAIAVPISQGITEAAGFGLQSNGSAAISLAAFLGFSQMSFLFLTGGEQCLIAWNFLPPEAKGEFGWLSWFLVALPAAICVVVLLLVSIRALLPLAPGEKANLAKDFDRAPLPLGEPISGQERVILTTLILTVLGWATASIHGVNETWVALGSLLALLLFGALDREGFKRKLDWGLILFFGVLNSMSVVTHHLKVDEALSVLSKSWLDDFNGGVLGFLLVIFAVVSLARLFLRKTPTALVFTVIFLPFSGNIGVHPGVIVVAATMIGECFLFGYQDGPYQIAYSGAGFSHWQARKILAARYVATFVALALSVPCWRVLGFVR